MSDHATIDTEPRGRSRLSFGDFDPRDLVSRSEAAQLLGISRRTLEDWATSGHGPPYVRMGQGLRAPAKYRVVDLLAFIDANIRRSTTQD